jgi:hypothetical protein
MSLMDTIEDEIQQLADREAHWRGRALDLVGVVLENETCDELVDLARDILRDLRNERSLPIYGTTKPAAAAFRQVTVAGVVEIVRPVDQALPPAVVDPPAQIEAPYSPSEKLSEASVEAQSAPLGELANISQSVQRNGTSDQTAAPKRTMVQPTKAGAERRRAREGFKICKACDKRLPVASFTKHPNTADGYDPNCRACRNARLKERRGNASAQTVQAEARKAFTDGPVLKTGESVHVPETCTPEGQMPPPKPNPYLAVRIDKARDIYRKHVNAGGVISNDFEGGLMDECGLNRTEVMRIREEMLAQRSDGATLKASRNAQKWDTTPPL